MKNKNTLLMAIILTMTVAMTCSCEKVKDAANMREHEAAKDMAEDLESAERNAVKAAKEEFAEAKAAAKRAVNE